MKQQQLEIFVTAVECGTLTSAAEKLFLAQPALSLSIKSLEKELGVFLLNRSKSGVTPTPMGAEVYHYAKRILDMMEEVQHIPSDFHATATTMRMAASSFVGHIILLESFLSLQNQEADCSAYEFSNRNDSKNRLTAEHLVTALDDQELHLGLLTYHHYHADAAVAQLEKRGFQVEYLGRTPFCIVVREGHPLLQRRASIPDLARYPNAIYESNLNDYIRKTYGEEYCQKETIRIENHTGLRNYLFRTDAISVMTHAELQQSNLIHSASLHQVDLAGLNWYQHLYMVRGNTEPTPHEVCFLEELRATGTRLLT